MAASELVQMCMCSPPAEARLRAELMGEHKGQMMFCCAASKCGYKEYTSSSPSPTKAPAKAANSAPVKVAPAAPAKVVLPPSTPSKFAARGGAVKPPMPAAILQRKRFGAAPPSPPISTPMQFAPSSPMHTALTLAPVIASPPLPVLPSDLTPPAASSAPAKEPEVVTVPQPSKAPDVPSPRIDSAPVAATSRPPPTSMPPPLSVPLVGVKRETPDSTELQSLSHAPAAAHDCISASSIALPPLKVRRTAPFVGVSESVPPPKPPPTPATPRFFADDSLLDDAALLAMPMPDNTAVPAAVPVPPATATPAYNDAVGFEDVLCDAHHLPVSMRVSTSAKNPGRRYYGRCGAPGCDFFRWHDDVALERQAIAAGSDPVAARAARAWTGSTQSLIPNLPKPRLAHIRQHDLVYARGLRRLGANACPLDSSLAARYAPGTAHPHTLLKETAILRLCRLAAMRGIDCESPSEWEEVMHHVDVIMRVGDYDEHQFSVHVLPATPLREGEAVQFAQVWIPVTGIVPAREAGPVVGRMSRCDYIVVEGEGDALHFVPRTALWRLVAEIMKSDSTREVADPFGSTARCVQVAFADIQPLVTDVFRDEEPDNGATQT